MGPWAFRPCAHHPDSLCPSRPSPSLSLSSCLFTCFIFTCVFPLPGSSSYARGEAAPPGGHPAFPGTFWLSRLGKRCYWHLMGLRPGGVADHPASTGPPATRNDRAPGAGIRSRVRLELSPGSSQAPPLSGLCPLQRKWEGCSSADRDAASRRPGGSGKSSGAGAVVRGGPEGQGSLSV